MGGGLDFGKIRGETKGIWYCYISEPSAHHGVPAAGEGEGECVQRCSRCRKSRELGEG